ncbi:MAG: replication-relaxation family protein [bacterium]|nr:replication-relaxation family protein [bacterium]
MKKSVIKLTARDCDLLVDLYKHRFLSISQIERLHFPSLQTAYRRMRILKSAGLVSSFTVANIDEALFMVSTKGLHTVAATIGVDRDDLKWNETPSKPRDYYFMRHFLAINDFRITLRKACTAADIKLLGFIPDYYGERTSNGAVEKYIKDLVLDMPVSNAPVSHIPDGVFALESNGKAALMFLEVDRGTEVLSDAKTGVLKALRFYTAYLLDGKFQRFAKDFNVPAFKGFRLLLITTTKERAQNIRSACDALPAPDKAKQFLWIASVDDISEKTLFTKIWRSLDSRDESFYGIL